MTSASTPDKYQQITYRQESRHQALMHISIWVQCSSMQQMLSLCQFDKTNMIPMSGSEVDALKKDECLQLMEKLGEAQPRRGVLMVELKAIIKDLLFSKEREQDKPLLGFAKLNKSQLADKARLQIPVSENHTREYLTKIIRGDFM